MKLVSSEFDKQDKSVAAVDARNELLNKAIDAQKEKVSALEAALKNAADSFGVNGHRTQNWAIQLNNAKAWTPSAPRLLRMNYIILWHPHEAVKIACGFIGLLFFSISVESNLLLFELKRIELSGYVDKEKKAEYNSTITIVSIWPGNKCWEDM